MASGSSLKITFLSFILSKTCYDNKLAYTAKLSNLNPLPNFIVFSGFTLIFSINTVNDADVGIYDIILTGTAPNGQSATSSF